MSENVILLSIPGLREKDLASMPNLARLTSAGQCVPLEPSFPAVTCPVQANLTTGVPPSKHGVVANGFYYREKQEVEMWTAWNDCILSDQIWDTLAKKRPELTSAVWFPMHSKGCGATYVCTPAPIHNPDGSESLWCYTKPEEMYGQLRDEFGHFPLQHFWGPMAQIASSAWIADSAVWAAKKYQPNFFYIYLTHLDYAAQKLGPDSAQAQTSVMELDEALGSMIDGIHEAYGDTPLTWMVASEYTIVPVDHVLYPNRVLREAGLLQVREEEDGEHLDFANSDAWAMVDHQFSHVFVKDAGPEVVKRVAELFQSQPGVAEVLVGEQMNKYDLYHERCGEVVLVSKPNSWQAYYWWLDDACAPGFAHTVDIHRKPGYDPAEMHFDPQTKGISLDATLVGGSHGAPVHKDSQRGVLLTSETGVTSGETTRDVDVAGLVLRQFGI